MNRSDRSEMEAKHVLGTVSTGVASDIFTGSLKLGEDGLHSNALTLLLSLGATVDGDLVVVAQYAQDDGAGAPDAGTWADVPAECNIYASDGFAPTAGVSHRIGLVGGDFLQGVGTYPQHIRWRIQAPAVDTDINSAVAVATRLERCEAPERVIPA